MPWTAQPITGATVVATRDFVAPGFAVSGGFRHFVRFDPNPWSRSAGVALATLGLAALPRGALVGNEMGLDLSSRMSWVSSEAIVIETALRPVFRVQTASARISLPSVLGTFLPAIGFVAFGVEDADPHAALQPRYEGLLLRWGFGVRFVAMGSPFQLFAELEPNVALIIPTRAEAPHAMVGVNLQIGFTPMQR